MHCGSRPLIAGFLIVGCASDRGITGPGVAPPITASASVARPVSNRCPHDGAPGPLAFIVFGGRLYTDGNMTELPKIDLNQIERLDIVKGADATARYGLEAGVHGVVIVTMRPPRVASVRPAP